MYPGDRNPAIESELGADVGRKALGVARADEFERLVDDRVREAAAAIDASNEQPPGGWADAADDEQPVRDAGGRRCILVCSDDGLEYWIDERDERVQILGRR